MSLAKLDLTRTLKDLLEQRQPNTKGVLPITLHIKLQQDKLYCKGMCHICCLHIIMLYSDQALVKGT